MFMFCNKNLNLEIHPQSSELLIYVGDWFR
jgi:hypothetical protein